MNLHSIKSEQEYNLALKEVEELWGAQVGTPEGDKLEVLITQIEAYESKHHSIGSP